MGRLLAEDLLLLCWDDERGKPHRATGQGMYAGIAGALLIDATTAGVVELDEGRVRPTGTPPTDPLVAMVVGRADRRWREPKAATLVQGLAGTGTLALVRERLVEGGLLRTERRRLLGLIPVTRHVVADHAAATVVRQSVRDVLGGATRLDEADQRHLLLASLTAPTGAVEALFPVPSERAAAEQRATELADADVLASAVGEAVGAAQAAATAAVVAAAAAGAASAGSAGSSGSC